jgi:hypothetical protein
VFDGAPIGDLPAHAWRGAVSRRAGGPAAVSFADLVEENPRSAGRAADGPDARAHLELFPVLAERRHMPSNALRAASRAVAIG